MNASAELNDRCNQLLPGSRSGTARPLQDTVGCGILSSSSGTRKVDTFRAFMIEKKTDERFCLEFASYDVSSHYKVGQRDVVVGAR